MKPLSSIIAFALIITLVLLLAGCSQMPEYTLCGNAWIARNNANCLGIVVVRIRKNNKTQTHVPGIIVDWGDKTPPDTAHITNSLQGLFEFNHTYFKEGDYLISVKMVNSSPIEFIRNCTR